LEGAEMMLKILEKGRILVVADVSKNQRTVVKTLESDGYDVDIATTEDQALFQLYDELPDLITIDLKMRSSEGMRTFEKIMNHEQWKYVPVVVMTEDADVVKFLDAYHSDYLETVSEPMNPLVLRRRVEQVLERRSLAKTLDEELLRVKSKNQIISEAETTIQTQQKQIEILEKELNQTVIKDTLTGLNNRRASMLRYEEEVARHDRNDLIFSMILCDIDNLADVNVKYGRKAGDVVIKKASELLTQGKRQQDYASRWSGGEFLLILPDTDLEGAIIYADRARNRIANHVFKVSDGQFKVTMTFGVLCYDRTMPSELAIQLSDKALKKGKESGRNKVVTADLL